MVTFAQLHAADPQRWVLAAGTFRVAGASVADRCSEVDAVVTGLRDAWSGIAGAAALARLNGTRAALAAAYPALISVDQALSEFAETIRLAQDALADAATPAAGSIVRVDGDGTARLVPGAVPPDATDHADLDRVTRAIAGALDAAELADRDTARRLALATAGFDDPEPRAPADIPPYGTEPGTVATWWAHLDEPRRLFMIDQRSADVTRLDGIPVDARDQAGRVLLRRQHDELIQRRHLLLAGPPSRSVRAELATVDGTLSGLDQLTARLDDPYDTRAYLLRVDAGTDRAIVAVGDPDRTDNVLTLVPGLGSGLAGIATSLTALDHIAGAGSRYAGPWDDLSTVGWLDYGAPANLHEAMSDQYALDAVDGLARFDSGMRMTHEGPPAHETMLGYSYGSTVVGVTARDRPLSADDLVFVASPGVGVKHARDLGIDPHHVWATVARGDSIHAAIDPISRLVDYLTLGAPGAMWFGPDPTGPRFGGRVFASDPGTWRHPILTHQSYFVTGSTSLENIAKIAMGHRRDVS